MSDPIQQESLTLDDDHVIRYTVVGDLASDKPVLVFIVGSVGLGSFYHRLATHLSSHFSCVYFNRRGFTETPTEAAPVCTETSTSELIPQQASDAAQLIKEIKKRTTSPIYSFATSFGATIALELLISHPHLVNTVILHEPMLPTLLPKTSPERKKIMDAFEAMQLSNQPFSLFAAALLGEEAASAAKGNDFWSQAPPGNFAQAMKEGPAANMYQPAIGDIQKASRKLVLMGGVERKGLPVRKMVEALCEVLPVERRRVYEMPGAHFSFAGGKLAKDSAACTLSVLGMANAGVATSKM
ncbi:hypothetical protein PRZ48_009023 [Zasmidium cellare]|uniref:AB hydrolase-1 domain-containing protein n=1 Tax=Zasmidium cellare TaxID=395010 RepID=A0ABR0EHW5_ZASCE|nr:hypothetical protein PRZ48_009023 [Zasmidium cellare]